MSARPWWREGVVHEVYVRSFSDGTGDGVGDLPGLRARLPYIRDLGVDGLWITPFYPSADHDAGYDVIDHRAVDPRLGTLDDVDAVIADAHALGLRVMVDLVLNHVSSEHPWFREAVAAGPGSPERARFHVRPGRDGGATAPTGWPSIFGGSAWEPFGDGEWYLHLFDVHQPDLNHDHPEVRADAEATLRFWLDRGVDGVRFDAAGGLAKDPTYPELPERWQPGNPSPYSDLDAVHDHYRRFARILGEYDGDRVGVAEVWGEPHVIEPYVRADELQQAFAIDPLFRPLDATLWRGLLADQLDAVTRHGRLPAWAHGNHDVKRAVNRWGEDGARAVLLLMLALPGCLYLYAGDELGLPEVDLPDDAITDPTFRRSGGADRGRDGARVPLPWTSGPAPFGFAPDGTPTWLPQPGGWGEHAVERQECDPDSMLALTRRAIRIRNEMWRGAGDEVTWLDDLRTGCLGFRRGRSVCVARFGAGPEPDLSAYGDVHLVGGASGGSMTWWLR